MKSRPPDFLGVPSIETSGIFYTGDTSYEVIKMQADILNRFGVPICSPTPCLSYACILQSITWPQAICRNFLIRKTRNGFRMFIRKRQKSTLFML